MKRSDFPFYRNIFLVVAVPFFLIQLIPYGHNHSNPPVLSEPAWDSEELRSLVVRACYDCHSNQTTWPWYSNVAPISWLVQEDVDDARQAVNFTEWDQREQEIETIITVVYIDHMPPPAYQMMHPASRFTEEERQYAVQGLQKMFPELALGSSSAHPR